MDLASQLLEGFLRAVFPETCPVCGAGGEVPGPCPEHRLPGADRRNRCKRCAALLPAGLPRGHRCDACARRSLRLRTVVTLGDYGARAPLKDWILALKHGGRRELARPLGRSLGRLWLELHGGQDPPLLVPVPLHPVRRLERGYDQAARIADQVAEATGGTLCRALRRRRWTAPQGSPLESREANVAGAFDLRRGFGRELNGQHLWLVDDVLTSGATLRACARVLRRGGARQVSALVVARAVREPPGD